MIAFMTHILLDLPNCKGIQLFWPIPGHHCFKLCASNGWVNRILCLAGTVMAINLFTGFAGISIFNWIIKNNKEKTMGHKECMYHDNDALLYAVAKLGEYGN